MIGTKFDKKNYDETAYCQAALRCNTNGTTIVDRGDYWEVVSIPAPTLEDVKQSAIDTLKQARDEAEVQPIEVGGYRYDCDDKARDRINGAVTMLDGTTETLSWTTADNTEATVSADDLKAIIRAVAARSNVLHTRYRTRKSAIESAVCAEDVDAILAEEGLSV